MYGDKTRMVQSSSGFCFTFKSRHFIFITGQIVGKEFNGYLSLKIKILVPFSNLPGRIYME